MLKNYLTLVILCILITTNTSFPSTCLWNYILGIFKLYSTKFCISFSEVVMRERSSTSKKNYLQLVLLWWSGTKSSISLRYACKLVQLWKRVWRPSKKKLKTELQYDPAIHFWVFTQRNLKY